MTTIKRNATDSEIRSLLNATTKDAPEPAFGTDKADASGSRNQQYPKKDAGQTTATPEPTPAPAPAPEPTPEPAPEQTKEPEPTATTDTTAQPAAPAESTPAG